MTITTTHSLKSSFVPLFARPREFPLPLLTRATQSKGGFPLSCYFYVLMHVKFTCLNKMEEMHKKSRVKS